MAADETIIEEHIVINMHSECRLSDYAVGKFESLPSRKSVKKAIKNGILKVDGEISNTGHWVKEGEVLTVHGLPYRHKIYEREIEVLFEDDHLAAVQKPADLPTSGNSFRTLRNALPFNLSKSPRPDALIGFEPVHRLDRQTGGILLIAKTRTAARKLGEQFQNKSVEKKYAAIVHGNLEREMKLSTPIDGATAESIVRPIQFIDQNRFGSLTRLELVPITGRTNQLRIHLSEIGHPILGDEKFGGQRSGRGLLLFAFGLSFPHPISGESMIFEVPLPKKFSRFDKSLKP